MECRFRNRTQGITNGCTATDILPHGDSKLARAPGTDGMAVDELPDYLQVRSAHPRRC